MTWCGAHTHRRRCFCRGTHGRRRSCRKTGVRGLLGAALLLLLLAKYELYWAMQSFMQHCNGGVLSGSRTFLMAVRFSAASDGIKHTRCSLCSSRRDRNDFPIVSSVFTVQHLQEKCLAQCGLARKTERLR